MINKVLTQDSSVNSNSTNIEIKLSSLITIINVYCLPLIAVNGLTFNIISLIGFNKIAKENRSAQNIFNYLSVKSM
jgi:hypothetical protein